jgi:Spy/CpxP family protein refolding chaperone
MFMKKMLMYSILCVAAGGLLLLTTVPAHAQKKEAGARSAQGKAQMEKEMAEGEKAAGISQEQRDKLKALRAEFQKKQQALREQIKAKREAIRQELDSPKPNRAKAEALAKEMNQILGQLAMNRIDEVFKIRAILTYEQFQKLREFHEKNKEKFQEKMKERMKDGKGHQMGGGGSWHEQGGMPGVEGDDLK